MILDQGTGFHEAQAEHVALGWMRTWVSAQGQDTATTFSLEFSCPARVFDYTAPQRTIDYQAPAPR